MRIPQQLEATSLGAAILGASAVGAYDTVEQAAAAMVRSMERISVKLENIPQPGEQG